MLCPIGHNVSMMGVTEVQAWSCDQCGYLWIKVSGRNPLRCPGCRTRRWNSGRGGMANAVSLKATRAIHAGSSPDPPTKINDKLQEKAYQPTAPAKSKVEVEKFVSRALAQAPASERSEDQSEAPVRICRNPDCGKVLVESRGKWSCADVSCPRYGMEVKR